MISQVLILDTIQYYTIYSNKKSSIFIDKSKKVNKSHVNKLDGFICRPVACQ